MCSLAAKDKNPHPLNIMDFEKDLLAGSDTDLSFLVLGIRIRAADPVHMPKQAYLPGIVPCSTDSMTVADKLGYHNRAGRKDFLRMDSSVVDKHYSSPSYPVDEFEIEILLYSLPGIHWMANKNFAAFHNKYTYLDASWISFLKVV